MASSSPSRPPTGRRRPPTPATTSCPPGEVPVWCTSWRQDATTLVGPLLGLPPLPHVDLPRPQITTSHPNGYLWKRDHVDAWLADAPVAWIDDDFTALDHAWARARNAEGIATLLIQPDPHVGLLPAHLQAALEWAAALSTPAGRDAGGRQEVSAAEAVQLP